MYRETGRSAESEAPVMQIVHYSRLGFDGVLFTIAPSVSNNNSMSPRFVLSLILSFTALQACWLPACRGYIARADGAAQSPLLTESSDFEKEYSELAEDEDFHQLAFDSPHGRVLAIFQPTILIGAEARIVCVTHLRGPPA